MEMKSLKLAGLLAGGGLLVVLVSIAHWFRPTMPQIAPVPFASLGRVVAAETVKTLAGHGRIAVVISPQHQRAGNPVHAEWENFQNSINKQNAISLAATEVVLPDPNEMVFGASCSGAQLAAILAKYSTVDALVFLIGLPEWNTLQARGGAPSPGGAKIIVAMNESPTKAEYGGYFGSGFLSVLIALRPGSAAGGKSQPAQDWLAKYCQIYTPQNADTLPE